MDRQEAIEFLLDHYQNPRNQGALDEADVAMPGGNPGCGDVVTMYVTIQKTRFGMMIRAAASNPEMATSLGLDIRWIHALVFSAGVALAAFAGMIAAPVSSVFPGMGSQVLIVCFVIVVIGGIGSLKGALIAALLIGFADTFGKVLFPDYASIAVYLLMAVVLLFRPLGLFGRA